MCSPSTPITLHPPFPGHSLSQLHFLHTTLSLPLSSPNYFSSPPSSIPFNRQELAITCEWNQSVIESRIWCHVIGDRIIGTGSLCCSEPDATYYLWQGMLSLIAQGQRDPPLPRLLILTHSNQQESNIFQYPGITFSAFLEADIHPSATLSITPHATTSNVQ
jgi:hypothetical protein